MTAYYNEFDPFAAQWLRNLIAAGRIPPGDVDERSIVDVAASDLAGYTQCHFFAGIGGWAYAARIAGWPDSRELWTGSPPCQPFSVAGKGRAQADDRHLWPHLFRLASACRPAVLMGEQVAAAVGKDWLDGVFADLEGIGYACGAAVVPACAVNAPHRRDRLWFVADAHHARLEGLAGHELQPAQGRGEPAGPAAAPGLLDCPKYAGRPVADPDRISGQVHTDARGREDRGCAGQEPGPGGACDGAVADSNASEWRTDGATGNHAFRAQAGRHQGAGDAWAGSGWIVGHDGKARRVEPSIPLLAHGVPGRVGRLRAYGNAIAPPLAAEVIGAFMEVRP